MSISLVIAIPTIIGVGLIGLCMGALLASGKVEDLERELMALKSIKHEGKQ